MEILFVSNYFVLKEEIDMYYAVLFAMETLPLLFTLDESDQRRNG